MLERRHEPWVIDRKTKRLKHLAHTRLLRSFQPLLRELLDIDGANKSSFVVDNRKR